MPSKYIIHIQEKVKNNELFKLSYKKLNVCTTLFTSAHISGKVLSTLCVL